MFDHAPAAPATTGPTEAGATPEAPKPDGTRFSGHGAIPAPTAAGSSGGPPPSGPTASDRAFGGQGAASGTPGAATTPPPAATDATLGALLKKNNQTIDSIKGQSWMMQSTASELLKAKGVDSPTKSQLDDTIFKMSAAIDANNWESFTAPFDGQVLKVEDGVNERLGNIFSEKKVFTPDQLTVDHLKMSPSESTALHGGFESGVSGNVLAASFINTHARSEGDFSHAYGDEAWQGFVRANTYLESIPKGQFLDQLDVNVLMEVNRLIHAPDLGIKAKLLRTIAMIGRGGKWDKGGELRDGRQFAHPEQYSKPEMENMTEAGVGVKQVSHDADGGGKALLEYPKPEEVRPGLERIIAELKADLAQPNPDPIGAASKFQRHFVALHPFGDSNGRTSRILMNRILGECDLPPAILADQNRDVSLSPEEWRTEVAKGCARSKEYLGSNRVNGKDKFLGQMGIHGVEMSPDAPITLGGLPFDLGSDGLLYDPTGRPWIVENNDLIPLSQMEHYVLSRRVLQSQAVAPTPGGDDRKIGLDNANAKLQTITLATRALYTKVAADPAAGKDIVVRDDAKAREADAEYKLAPAPEVGKLLADLTDLSALDPSKLFQVNGAHGTTTSSILSKYAQIDLEFWYVEKGLRDTKQDGLVAQVHVHRAKLFEAAKAALEAAKDPARVSAENPQGFHYRYEKMMFDTSPLRHASFDAALKADGDKTTTVWRGDYAFARVIGMAPNNDVRQPDAKAIAKQREKKHQITNMYDDLAKLEGSAVGRQYICTTSDLSLLASSFADSSNSQTVNIGMLPKFIKEHLLAWLDPKKEGTATAQIEAERKTEVDRGDSVVTMEGGGGKEIKDAFGIPGTIATVKVTDKERGKLQVTAQRKAFQIVLDKEALLPGVYALGGPSFESEQEIHGLERVQPWDIKGSYKAETLKEEFPVANAPEPTPAPATTPAVG